MKFLIFVLPALVCSSVIEVEKHGFYDRGEEAELDNVFGNFEHRRPQPHRIRIGNVREKWKRDTKKVNNVNLEGFDPKRYEKSVPVLDICRKEFHEIESQDELNYLQVQCDSVMGTIHINKFDNPIVKLGNIEFLKGDLIVEDCTDILIVEGKSLERVGGKFVLQRLTSLATVDVPRLKEVEEIDWKVVPILNTVNMDKDLTNVKKITISDSSLAEIKGFKNIETIDVFNINNNRFLETIQADIKNVKTQFTVHANARELELEMPELVFAENITVRDTSKVSFPKLEKVSSSMEFIENLFTSLEIPTLTSVGGTLGLIDNSNLEIVDLKNITSIQGGLMVTNNEKLNKIDFLPKLKQIGGAIFFEGLFEETNFPDLKLVKGSAYINSVSENLDCTPWTFPVNGKSIIRGGKINCTSGKKQNTLSVNENGEVLTRKEEDTSMSKSKEQSTGKKSNYFSRVTSAANSPGLSQLITVMAVVVLGSVCVTAVFN